MTIRVDIVIPSYNGLHHLEVCLPALERQSYRRFRVVVVDDGSADGTMQALAERWPQVTALATPRNAGFARAVNCGIAAGRSELVALLNNDTEPTPGWLAALVDCIDRHSGAGAIASKLLLFDRRDHLHSAGDTFSVRGEPGNRGVWQLDSGQFSQEQSVFGACAGAALYRRRALDEAAAIDGAVLDPDLFMYCEDVDLSWRLRLLGWDIVYAPEAVVYHRLSATGGGPLASYYVARNITLVQVKDLPAPLLRTHLAAIVRRHAGSILGTLPHLREPAARARLRGTVASLRLMPTMLRKRRRIQRARRASISQIERLLVP